MSELGPELRRRRVSAGLSLTALAVAAHFTKGYLSKVENGRVRVNRGVAEVYDKALGADGELCALVPDEAPWRTGGAIVGLPGETRHFVGRESELAALSTALVHSDDVRVCVVHGMAGAGKTALAVAAARRPSATFPTAACSSTCEDTRRACPNSRLPKGCSTCCSCSAWRGSRCRPTSTAGPTCCATGYAGAGCCWCSTTSVARARCARSCPPSRRAACS
jgi:transcriptional regulator with XRE-family HTH domain